MMGIFSADSDTRVHRDRQTERERGRDGGIQSERKTEGDGEGGVHTRTNRWEL